MKTLFLALFLALPLSFGHSETDPSRPSSVRVKSSICKTGESLMTTGVPVRYKGSVYVLTSEWGVLEELPGGTGEICHEILVGRTSHRAELAVYDWGAGIALLRSDEPMVGAVDLDTFKPGTPSKLTIFGFPIDKSLAEIRGGRIVAAKSTRHHLPSHKFSYEVISDRIDRGFIGAPVYGEQLEGIVSGQWIEIVAGTKARVHEWKSDSPATPNHLIVIPLALVKERLDVATEKPSTYQPAEAKLKDRNVMFVGSTRWDLACPEGAGGPPKDGIGPIGGSDGAGVGGSMKGSETCTLVLESQKNFALEAPFFLTPEMTKALEDASSTHGKFTVPFLFDRDAGKHIARIPFLTMPNFFKEYSGGVRIPVLVIQSEPPASSSAAYDRLRVANRKLKDLLTAMYPKIATDEEERMEFRKFYSLTLLLDSVQWKLVSHFSDVQAVISSLHQSDFAKGIEWADPNTGKMRPLREVLLMEVKIVERLHREAGGKP